MNYQPIESALHWARSIQLRAPVSDHHRLAVSDLWPMVEPLGVKTALEVGAGEPPGLIVTMLREHGIDAVSLDGLSDCDVPGDMHDLPFEDNSFDLVCARHALEHVLIPYVALSEMARVSRRYLLVVVPQDSIKTLEWPDHLNVYGKGGWELIFQKIGLKIVEMDVGNHTERHRRGIELDMEYRYLLEKGE